jgi:hypothetical protein
MELTLPQKKKHLLLLNRIMRAELKKDIIPTPSKLTEAEVNEYFKKLFVKREDHYIPVKNKISLEINEELFKGLIKKKRSQMTKEERVVEKEEKKKKELEEREMSVNMYYNQFVTKFIKPYILKKNKKEDVKDIQKNMIDKYIKFSKQLKNKIKDGYSDIWETILNPAFLEREKRKERLVEEEIQLKDTIKKEARNKL